MKLHYLHYVWYKAAAELKTLARKNYLSNLWWVLEPAVQVAIYYFVFGMIFERGGPGFEFSLMVGVLVWLWFSNAVSQAMKSIVSARAVISQIYIPKYIFPLIPNLVACIKYHILMVLVLVVFIANDFPGWNWLYLPLLILAQLLLTLAFGLLFAAIVPFLPDLEILLRNVLRLGMFCSGVFYSVDRVPEAWRDYFLLNPVANMIEQFRRVLLQDLPPDFAGLAGVMLGSLLLIAATCFFIGRNDYRYAKLVI